MKRKIVILDSPKYELHLNSTDGKIFLVLWNNLKEISEKVIILNTQEAIELYEALGELLDGGCEE